MTGVDCPIQPRDRKPSTYHGAVALDKGRRR